MTRPLIRTSWRPLWPLFDHIDPAFVPEALQAAESDPDNWAARTYAKSVFDDRDAVEALLAKGSAKAFAKLSKDPLYALIKSMRNAYFDRVAAGYGAASAELDSLTGVYTNGLRTLFPERAFFPDANSTLRLTYGKVEGSSPYDGMTYLPFTTAKGILQKYIPGDADFDLPADLGAALQKGAWGAYANEEGELSPYASRVPTIPPEETRVHQPSMGTVTLWASISTGPGNRP